MADKKTATKADEAPEMVTPEMVTIYHPDERMPAVKRTRQVPADKVSRWEKSGWLTENPRSN